MLARGCWSLCGTDQQIWGESSRSALLPLHISPTYTWGRFMTICASMWHGRTHLTRDSPFSGVVPTLSIHLLLGLPLFLLPGASIPIALLPTCAHLFASQAHTVSTSFHELCLRFPPLSLSRFFNFLSFFVTLHINHSIRISAPSLRTILLAEIYDTDTATHGLCTFTISCVIVLSLLHGFISFSQSLHFYLPFIQQTY